MKVKINRYSGLCLRTLGEMIDAIPSLLNEIGIPWPTNRQEGSRFRFFRASSQLFPKFVNIMLEQIVLAKVERPWPMNPHTDKCCGLFAVYMRIFHLLNHFKRSMLNGDVSATAEKGEAIDQSSLRAVFRRIVDIKGIHKTSDFLYMLEAIVKRYPSLCVGHSFILHNFIFPEVIKAGSLLIFLLTSLLLKQPDIFLQGLFQFIQQDFEPEN